MKHFKFFARWIIDQTNLFYLFLIVLIIPNIILSFTETLGIAGRICNIVLPFAVYYAIMSRMKNCGKTFLFMFPIVFFAAFQLVLLYLFRKSIIAVDMFLNLVTTNASEAFELLDNMIPALLFVFILYIPSITFAIMSTVKKRTMPDDFMKKHKKWSNVMIVVGGVFLAASYISNKDYRIKNDLYPANVCYNIYLAVQRDKATRNYAETSKDFTFNARSLHQDDRREIYVIVVGETSRAANWELNGYNRPTNPLLRKIDGLAYFPYTLSESNTTHKSVPMLLSSVSSANHDSIYYRKGVITAFKECGFHSVFYSNQQRNNSFIDFFGMEADVYSFIKENAAANNKNLSDKELLVKVESELKKGRKKQLIVLHTYGSHFNYRERYPAEDAYFLPDTPVEAEYKFKDNLINAYDNTIRYTDKFLAHLADMLQKEDADAVMIYTSDHGEDIYDDDRKLFLHSSPVPTYYQIHVPFLIWASDSYRNQYPEIWDNVMNNRNKNVSSSTSFFNTIVQMAGIETPYAKKAASLANDMYEESPHTYLNDHNNSCSLKDMGMGRIDFDMMKKYGIKGW